MIVKILIHIIIAIASVAFMIPQYTTSTEEGTEEEKDGILGTVKKHKLLVAILAVGCLAFAVYSLLLKTDSWKDVLQNAHNQLVWNAVLLVAVIDFKVKKIPNRVVLFILLVHTVYLVTLVCAAPGQWKTIVFPSLIGLFAGALFMTVCFVASRGGVGGGDLKLYSSLGYCYGLVGIVAILLYSLLPAIIVGVALMVMKKAKFKTMMPMAPFILLGLTLYLVLR